MKNISFDNPVIEFEDIRNIVKSAALNNYSAKTDNKCN